ncbi:hypothetical protein ACIPW5_06000 [Streptomyces sp. NPDC090077]|uniref:hypothetical protein n=1 Tax=Streptomyces sp. NPDC090077 TaxID=3365938 RepID=UPI00380F4C0F
MEAVHTGALVAELLAAAGPEDSGALWRLQDAGRQLDANLVRHLPGAGGALHTEHEVDVMLVTVAGSGTLTRDGADIPLAPGVLAFLARGAPRALLAGPDGLAVLTVHRRRSGIAIGRPATPAEPPAACAVHLVCGRCHRHAIEAAARYCSDCGTPLPGRPGG